MGALSPTVTAALDGVDPKAVWARVRPGVLPTSLVRVESLEELLGGAHLTLALETAQHTGSFKYRAAWAATLHADAPRLLTASSGNFGAALAAAAARCGKGCTVVMPARSAEVKIAAVRGQGAEVDLVDTDRSTREARVAELALADPAAHVVSPYDDPYVICGNATLGAEIFEHLAPDFLVAPVGGGGLSSGLVVAAMLLRPQCKVVAGEPTLANDASRSLRTGTLVANEREPNTVCDGARTRSLGQRNFAILREGLSGIIEVEDDAVARAMGLLRTHAGVRVEPTGALGLAAVLTDPDRFRGCEVVCVVSGGNVDPAVYARMVAGG
jgi:threonine dehydratase